MLCEMIQKLSHSLRGSRLGTAGWLCLFHHGVVRSDPAVASTPGGKYAWQSLPPIERLHEKGWRKHWNEDVESDVEDESCIERGERQRSSCINVYCIVAATLPLTDSG